jgi:hypothetical protein
MTVCSAFVEKLSRRIKKDVPMQADLSVRIAGKEYKGDPKLENAYTGSRKSVFGHGRARLEIHNRNFQNLSAYATGQIWIGIAVRLPKEGLPPIDNSGF